MRHVGKGRTCNYGLDVGDVCRLEVVLVLRSALALGHLPREIRGIDHDPALRWMYHGNLAAEFTLDGMADRYAKTYRTLMQSC